MPATVKEFIEGFSSATGEDLGACKHVARVFQQSEIFPVGVSGRGRAPEIELRQAIMFFLGYYGAAKPKDSAKVAKSFAGTTSDGEHFSGTLIETLEEVVNSWEHEDPKWWIDSVALMISGDHFQADLICERLKGEEEGGFHVRVGFSSGDKPLFSGRTAVIGGRIIRGAVQDLVWQLFDAGRYESEKDA